MRVQLIDYTPDALAKIARFARTCYRSEAGDNEALVRRLIKHKHMTPLEVAHLTFKIECDRATANALTRHRHATFCQESTHYVNYSKKAMPEFEIPFELGPQFVDKWVAAVDQCYKNYLEMVRLGVSHSLARGLLPLAFGTTLMMHVNAREVRHIVSVRYLETTGKEQAQVREAGRQIAEETAKVWPWLMEDMLNGNAVQEETGKLGSDCGGCCPARH